MLSYSNFAMEPFLTMNAEAMEMGARPAEGNLEGEVKIGDGMIRADEKSAQISGLMPRSQTCSR